MVSVCMLFGARRGSPHAVLVRVLRLVFVLKIGDLWKCVRAWRSACLVVSLVCLDS